MARLDLKIIIFSHDLKGKESWVTKPLSPYTNVCTVAVGQFPLDSENIHTGAFILAEFLTCNPSSRGLSSGDLSPKYIFINT